MSGFNKVSRDLFLQKYERYLPTAFDESLTILEKVNKIIETIIRYGDLSDEIVDYLNNFKLEFDDKLDANVDSILNKMFNQWLEDGTLAHIINDEVFNMKANKTDLTALENIVGKDDFKSGDSLWNEFNTFKVTPIWFGAVGDGIADDTSAIKEALNYACENNVLLDFGKYKYRITSQINIRCNCIGERAEIISDGITNNAAVLVGDKETDLKDLTIVLPNIINKVKDWTSSIGLEIAQVVHSQITVRTVGLFNTGLLMSGYNRGNAYNNIFYTHLFNNRVNLKIAAYNTGWVNENTFYGQRHSHTSDNGENYPGSKHIFITCENTHLPNNNVFIKPSIEGNTAEYAIDITAGSFNTFISPRFEGTIKRKVRFGEKSVTQYSHSNLIFYGFNAHVLQIEETTNARYNTLYDRDKVNTGTQYNLRNRSGGASGSVNVFPSNVNPLTASDSEYVVKLSQQGTHLKQTGDSHDRINLLPNGQINMGAGDSLPNKMLRLWGSDFMFSGGSLKLGNTNGYQSEHLIIGTYHLWVDDLGKLRIKNGTPTSNTDGIVVGSQE